MWGIKDIYVLQSKALQVIRKTKMISNFMAKIVDRVVIACFNVK